MEPIKIIDFQDHKIGEADIIRRILAGEKELYEILLRRNNQKLYRAIRSYIKDVVEIEDIMQNTYLKAYEKLHQFKHTSTYATWLIRIGINQALARLKEKGKVYQLYAPTHCQEKDPILDVSDKDQLNPEKKIIRKEVKQLLESTIDSLESKYRSVYILREVEEMSISEISECLDLSESNVKVRLHRAKAMLKEKLYEHALDKNIFEFGFSRCDKVTDFVMSSILK